MTLEKPGSIARIHLQWFAAEDEGRTEEPSDYKIKKAREEGRVAKSQDLISAVGLLLPSITLAILAPSMLKTMVEMIGYFIKKSTETDIGEYGQLFQAFISYFIQLCLPILVVAMLGAIISNVLQVGFLFTTKTIKPDPKRIIPKFGKYFKRTLFSTEALFNLGKSILKVGVIAMIAYLNISPEIPVFNNMFVAPFFASVQQISAIVIRIVIEVAILLIVFAVPDYIFQRRQWKESLKMSKQEVKEERKMYEGDPLIKSRLRQRMRELLSRNMAVNVPKADVIITNPTHFAIALEWNRETMPAPMVTAKGADEIAFRIKQLAAEANVPIVENKPLARALYAEIDIGDIIPDKYYQAIAAVLAYVYKLNEDSGEARSRASGAV